MSRSTKKITQGSPPQVPKATAEESKNPLNVSNGTKTKRNQKHDKKNSQTESMAQIKLKDSQKVSGVEDMDESEHLMDSAQPNQGAKEISNDSKKTSMIQTRLRPEIQGNKTGDSNLPEHSKSSMKRMRQKNPTSMNHEEQGQPAKTDQVDLSESNGDSSYELEDLSFVSKPKMQSCLKPNKRFRSDASSSVDMPDSLKKRLRDDAPAVVKQAISALSEKFSGPMLEELVDIVMKGYQVSDGKKIDRLISFWLDSLGQGVYVQALIAPENDLVKLKLHGMTSLDHLQAIMNEVQSDRSSDSSRSFLLASFNKHAVKVIYEQVKSLKQFASAETNQFLTTALVSLFSTLKDQLKEAHIVTALAMLGAEAVIQAMKLAGFADETFEWPWTTLIPFTKRRGKKPNQLQQYVWGAFAVIYPNLTPASLKLILKRPSLLGNHQAIQAISQIEKQQQTLVCESFFYCVSDGPDVHESIPMISNLFARSSHSGALLVCAREQTHGRLNVQDFVNLVQALTPITSGEFHTLFTKNKSLTEIVQTISKEKKARVAQDVDPTKLDRAISDFLKQHPNLVEIYEKVVIVSKRMEGSEFATYCHNNYQCLMAAQALSSDDKFKAVVLGPGQGKTFVMLLIAQFLLTENKLARVYIATTKELVYRQIQDDCRKHPAPRGRIVPMHIEDMRKIPRDGLIMLDEGDLYLKRMLLVFNGTELGGLASLRENRVIIFSATLSSYWQDVIMTVFQTSLRSMYYFMDAISMAGSSNPSVSIVGKVIPEFQQAMMEIVDVVSEKGQTCPIIVFTTAKHPIVKYKLETVCQERNMYFAEISTVDDALLQRDLSKNLDSGVWLVAREFGRGFDLKLAVDSLVIILDPIRDVTMTEASQMVGRSSRSLGISKGMIWLVGGTIPASTIPIAQVLREKEKRQTDDGAQILGAVLKVWDTDVSERPKLVKAFGKMGWQTDIDKLYTKMSTMDLAEKIVSRMD